MNQQAESIHFVVCLNNDGYPASLQVGKLYRVLPDEEAVRHGYLSVIDESGEAYAFDAHRFHPIELPPAVEEILLAVA